MFAEQHLHSPHFNPLSPTCPLLDAVICAVYGPLPVITAAPARAASVERVVERVAAREREAERRGERVARAVGVGDGPGRRRGAEAAARPPSRRARPPCRRRAPTSSPPSYARPGRSPLPTSRSSGTPPRAASAARAASPRGSAPARAERSAGDLAGDEEDGVVAVERQRPARPQLRPDRRDRPLAVRVDVRQRAAGRRRTTRRGRVTPSSSSRRDRDVAELVVAERGEEVARAGEPQRAARRSPRRRRRARPELGRVRDLPGGRDVVDASELRPLDVTDDGASHSATGSPRFTS